MSQYCDSTGTTSVWLQSISGRLLPSPFSVETTTSRLGAVSMYSHASPSASMSDPRKRAAGFSFPGGLEVSIWM